MGQAGRAYENNQGTSDDERRHQSYHKAEKTPDRATMKTPGERHEPPGGDAVSVTMTPGTATRLGRRSERGTTATAGATTSKTTHDRGGEESDDQDGNDDEQIPDKRNTTRGPT
ncbi:hypothetical protein [Haloferax sp. KTX1]|uniref:hypothetical protein n=1 Tax=Haloferax sp. KTX1 TaxID=2600597 RepID=UPI0011DCC154|nr:hypothetical protein [Haloferax sp. KTX1]